MGVRLRGLVGALKDTASMSKAALASPAAAAHLAVLRATAHNPSSSPPAPRHLAALLALAGAGASRLSASAVVSALAARLASTRDPAVALKALLALHHLLLHGPFVLRDLLAHLPLAPDGGRNPLALAGFPLGPTPEAWALAAWVRAFSRLFELLLAAARRLGTGFPRHRRPGPAVLREDPGDRLAGLLAADILAELDPLVAVVEATTHLPAPAEATPSELIREAAGAAEEIRVTAEDEIRVRVRELEERVDLLGFADSVELVCLLRRLMECKDRPSHWKWAVDDGFWWEAAELLDRAGEAVVRREREERGRLKKLRGSASARVLDRVALAIPVPFGSSRWVDG